MAMSKQATKYVGAIQLGTSAALTGYRVIQSILFLANALPIRDTVIALSLSCRSASALCIVG